MCHVLYVASDKPLPQIPWDVARPNFHSIPLESREEAVARHFSKPHIHYVGSHMQCGCGFFYPDRDKDGSIFPDELEEWNEVRAMRAQLTKYLHETVTSNGALELLMVWDGERSKAATRIGDLTPEAFLAESFPLDDFQLALVREEPDSRAVHDRNAL